MLIKLLTSYSDNRRGYEAGDVIKVANEDGRRLIGRKLAEPVRNQRVESTAKPPQGERAVSNGHAERRG